MSASEAPSRSTTLVQKALIHGVGAAFVAVFAYATASRFPLLHEAYWASIAAVVSLYPERDATTTAGVQQFLGSAVGGLIGWAGASWWNHHVAIYGAAVFVAVSLCYVFRCAKAARMAAVAVTIITLIPLNAAPGVVALHRFLEVSYGVACAIAYTAAFGCVAGLRDRWPPRLARRHSASTR